MDSSASLVDCYELLDRALESEDGIRVATEKQSEARELQTRLCKARLVSRQRSTQIYDRSDPAYGISQYDVLVVRMPKQMDGKWWVRIEPRRAPILIEDL